ncbi:MAG: phosphotransferase [Acidimicrobiia bacterium]
MRATWLSRRRLLLPASGRLPGGIWMHGACRPLPVLANTIAGHLSRLSVRLVPAGAAEVALPFDESELGEILARVPQLEMERPWVVMRPTDARRSRVMILGLDERRRPLVFVKATLDRPNQLALDVLERCKEVVPGFVVPRIEAVFQTGRWWLTVEEPLPQLAHRPARLRADETHRLVETIHGYSSDGPLVLAHGDLGPWNLRRFSDGRLAVIDWEYAHHAPVACDEIWFAVTRRLATTRQDGHQAGAAARSELAGLYADEDIAEAVAFIVAGRSGPEPDEVRDDVERSQSLLDFEDRLSAALTALAG